MFTWPWTNLRKELLERKKELDLGTVKTYTIEELRESISKCKPSQIESFFIRAQGNLNEFVWKVYRYFKPCNKKIRDAIPRQWCDLVDLTLIVNFEIIKSYVEEEMDSIDWQTDEKTKEVGDWLRTAYKYITEDRAQLQENLQLAYDSIDFSSKEPYNIKYESVIKVEEHIDHRDREVLINLAKYRQYLWS